MPDIIDAAQKSNIDSSTTTTNQADSASSATPPPPPPLSVPGLTEIPSTPPISSEPLPPPPPIGIPIPPTPIASPVPMASSTPIQPDASVHIDPVVSAPPLPKENMTDVLKQGANATKWTPTGAVPHHGVPLPDAPTPSPPIPVVSSTNQTIPPVVSTKNNAPLPDQSGPKKGGKGKIVALAGILLLLLTIPVGVFFISNQQKQIADVRSKASTGDTSYYKDGHCLDGNGQSAETCDDSNKCDSNGGCNASCGGQGENKTIDGIPNVCDVPNGFCKTGYSCRPTNVGQHQKMIDGKCVWQLCDGGAASCPDDAGCTGQGGPPNPTTTSAPNCAGLLKNCSESTPCCAGQNLVCQNPAGGGQRVCQQTGAGGSGDAFCDPNGAFKCNRVRAHTCTALNGQGQCNDNGTNVNDWPAGVSYANGCGQVDMVCNGGSKDGQLCGGFEIINQSCGAAPPSTNTPPPSAPTCQNIKVLNETGTDITSGLKDKTVKPKAGDTITLIIAGGGGNSAKYRLNGGVYDILTTKDSQGNFTKMITVPADPPNGSVTIEALLCTDGNGQTCQ